MRPTAGTCVLLHGRPTATPMLPEPVGSGPVESPTLCRQTTPANCRCASRPRPCCASPTGKPGQRGKAQDRFAELRELCSAAGDKVSLAIGMTGQATDVLYTGRSRGSRLASEQMALLETIGDPTLTIGLSVPAISPIGSRAGEVGEPLRWTQTVIDLADGDPIKGAGFGFGSPLAAALAMARLGAVVAGSPRMAEDLHEAWRSPETRPGDPHCRRRLDLRLGIPVRRAAPPMIPPYARASRPCRTPNESGDDLALALARYALGDALLHRHTSRA